MDSAHIIADQHSEIGRLRQLLAQAERRLMNAKIAADDGRADIAAEWIDMTLGLFAQRK